MSTLMGSPPYGGREDTSPRRSPSGALALDHPSSPSYGAPLHTHAVLRGLHSLQQKIRSLEDSRDHWENLWRREAEKGKDERKRLEESRARDLQHLREATAEREREIARLQERRPLQDLDLRDLQEQLSHAERLSDSEQIEFRKSLASISEDALRLRAQADKSRAELLAAEEKRKEATRAREAVQAEAKRAQDRLDSLVELNASMFERVQELEGRVRSGRRAERTKPSPSQRSRTPQPQLPQQLRQRLAADYDAKRERYHALLTELCTPGTAATVPALQQQLAELNMRQRELTDFDRANERTLAAIRTNRTPPAVPGWEKYMHAKGISAQLQSAAVSAKGA